MNKPITEEQYRRLCLACDSILTKPNSPPDTISVPWLHVIREHPIMLRNYRYLFDSEFSRSVLKQFAFQSILGVIAGIKAGIRIFRSETSFWSSEISKLKSYDVIVVSHLLTSDQLEKASDFYFETLPVDLINKGLSVLIVYVNHTSASQQELVRKSRRSSVPHVIIPQSLSNIAELEIDSRVKTQFRNFRERLCDAQNELESRILRRCCYEVKSTSTRQSLRISLALRDIVEACNPSAVITTYEGHPWERMIFRETRRINGNVRCIAYHHAAMFRLQHAARRPLGSEFDPDVLLTAGPHGLRHFRHSVLGRRVKLSVLGSNRRASNVRRTPSNICLVIPEGILDECIFLFSFSVLCAQRFPSLQFLWRLHPLIDFADIVKYFPRTLPPNITCSNNSLEVDVSVSRWALYRGSTAVVVAASYEVIPVYLEKEDELSINPLYEVEEFHPKVNSVEGFGKVVEGGISNPCCIDYCKTFYSSFDSEALISHLSLEK